MDSRTPVMPRRPNRPKRNDVPAKVDAEVMRVARIVAAYEEIDIAELISETLRPILEKKLAEHQALGQQPPIKTPRKPRPAD